MASDLTPREFSSLKHWAIFGQPGTPSKHRILAADWDTEPFEKPITTPWSLVSKLTSAQVHNLVNGFSPGAMEDKWFVCSEGPDEAGKLSVHLFRSWTGFHFATMVIKLAEEEKGGGEVTELTWESDPERVAEQDFEGAKETVVGVCQWVLDVKLPASA